MNEIIGDVISWLSFTIGYGVGRVRRNRLAPKPPKAICDSCDHGIGMHENKTGHCLVEYDDDHLCACGHYNGPIPYDTYIAREIT